MGWKPGLRRGGGPSHLRHGQGRPSAGRPCDPRGALTWNYVGFNHRGFLHDLRIDGEPALTRVLESLPAEGVGGVPRRIIEDLQAVPTKYFRLFVGRPPVSAYGRAGEVAAIRERLLSQIATTPTQAPAALADRDQPWWGLAVVPLLRGTVCGDAVRQVLNAPDETGLTREAWFDLHQGCRKATQTAVHPSALDPWLEAFETHEAVCLEALANPTLRNLKRVREADPLMGAMGPSGYQYKQQLTDFACAA